MCWLMMMVEIGITSMSVGLVDHIELAVVINMVGNFVWRCKVWCIKVRSRMMRSCMVRCLMVRCFLG